MDVLQAAATVAAVAAGVGGMSYLTRGVWRASRGLDELLDDWRGQPDRPGVPGRPGVMVRLARIEAQVSPNGGGSLHDQVCRVAAAVEDRP